MTPRTSTRFSYPLVLAAAALCYTALGAVLRILPAYVGGDLHAGPAVLGLAVGAPAITGILLRPSGGRQADRRGPAPVVLCGALVMAAGGLLALMSGASALIASRLIAGGGEALMMSATVLWLLRLAGEGRRGRALGHIGLANYAGLAAGPLIADALGAPSRVFVASALLPLAGGGLALLAQRPQRTAAPETVGWRALWSAILIPGVGLMLVNFGYAALVGFGSTVAAGRGGSALLPVFAVTVIAVRLLGGSLVDRGDTRRLAGGSALVEAAGLAVVALATQATVTVAATVVLACGQALAVPALGALALERVSPERHGAAAGLFFAWFDAGVAGGGPHVGLVAAAAGAQAGVVGAAAAVACVAPLVAISARRAARAGRRSARGREPERPGRRGDRGAGFGDRAGADGGGAA